MCRRMGRITTERSVGQRSDERRMVFLFFWLLLDRGININENRRMALLRVELGGSNEIISETARARHESLECTDHSPYCETARGVQHFQLTVRLRKPCHRRSSHRVASFARDLGQIQMNPSIVSRRKERGKKKRIISNYPSLQRYFIQL